MNYRGIIITGTSSSGKTSLVEEICSRDRRFAKVRAVTTRARRSDDLLGTYDYCSEDDFEEMEKQQLLLVCTTYRGKSYGVRKQDVEAIYKAGRIPILTLTPESADRLDGFREGRLPSYLSVFLDASDCVLDKRLASRGSSVPDAERNHDRTFRSSFLYLMEEPEVKSAASLIPALWDYSAATGVLSARLIRLMLESGMLLENSSADNVSGASYDLTVGDEYYYAGQIHHLSDREPILMIEPYDYAIVTSHERSKLPRDICARFDLSVSMFCQGVILSNGPQVDPGFRGPLFCLLFNTSSSPVLLKRRQHYATLEFHRLLEPTFAYHGQYLAKSLLHYLPTNAATGAINELKKELEEVRREGRNLQNMAWAMVSFILALVALWVSLK